MSNDIRNTKCSKSGHKMIDVGQNKGAWVCCPSCGKKARRTNLSDEHIKCDVCDTEFKAWVVKGFVTTFPFNPEEEETESFERFKDTHEMLLSLAQ